MTYEHIKIMLGLLSKCCDSVTLHNHESSITIAFDLTDEVLTVWTVHFNHREYTYDSVHKVTEAVKEWHDKNFLPF